MTWQKEWTSPSIWATFEGMEKVGDLALDFTDEGWNIYHVPTGACFDAAVPGFYPLYDKDQLLNWMKKIQEANSTAWTMLRLLNKDNYATNGNQAKKIIQEWCLSVKVV